MLPEQYKEFVLSYLKFIRRRSQPRITFGPENNPSILPPRRGNNSFADDYLSTLMRSSPPLVDPLLYPLNRFKACNVLNFDETPVPFDWNEGPIYEHKGSKTVEAHVDRSGWNKRQATVSLYVFADGEPRINPEIIFHGVPNGKLLQQEQEFYDPGVRVIFNEKAYANGETTDRFIEEVLLPTIRKTNSGQLDDFLLIYDCAAFHKTPILLTKLKANDITSCLVPPGCTPLVQPCDTHINFSFKSNVRDESDLYEHPKGLDAEWSVSDKRIMTIWIIGRAWRRFSEEKKAIVQKSFRDCGIFIPCDRSNDSLINIKGFESNEFDFTG
jgi:hypothetical protein